MHIRGCTCKKSRCQKKYCECFQLGVPCSDKCRCKYGVFISLACLLPTLETGSVKTVAETTPAVPPPPPSTRRRNASGSQSACSPRSKVSVTPLPPCPISSRNLPQASQWSSPLTQPSRPWPSAKISTRNSSPSTILSQQGTVSSTTPSLPSVISFPALQAYGMTRRQNAIIDPQ